MEKNKRHSIKHTMAAVLFGLIVSLGITGLADEKGTVTVQSAKIRALADPSSEQLGSVAEGGTVDIIGETTGTDGKVWLQVYVDANTKGYIRSDLVSRSGGSGTPTPSVSNTNQTPTTATPVEARKATVNTNNVNIRSGASTNHSVVGKANRGMVVTVTGEAAGSDGKKWWQISFTHNNKEVTGFILSDYVTFDEVPPDTAVSEITGEGNPGEGTPEESPEQTQPQEPEQAGQPSNSPDNIVLMNVVETPYIMPDFVAVDLNWNDQKINAYKNGKFYIFYAQMTDGEEGWYLYDSEKGNYQRYPYTAADATVPDAESGSVGMIPVIVLVVIVIILAAVVGLLAMKLREYGAYDDDYDEDEDYPDDDMDDFEELEEEEDAPRPGRRPQPVRRPQPQDSQAARRPQPQGGNTPQGQQPARRPQPQGGNTPQGQQAARRPQSQGGAPLGHPQGQQAARRPQPQGETAPKQSRNANGQGSQGGRPQPQGHPQGRRPQPQNDSKAKKPLEDDDMDFMDI